MVDRCNDAVAKEVEVDVGQDNLRMNMNSPLLLLPLLLVPMVEELLVLILESVEEAKRLLLLLLTTLIVCVAELFGLIMRRAVLCFPSIDVGFAS